MPFDIENVFRYHAPTGDQPARYERIRAKARELAQIIEADCIESREKSSAFTALQQTVMWANASIAIHGKQDAPPAPEPERPRWTYDDEAAQAKTERRAD